MGNPDRMSGKLTQNCWFGFEGRSARLILISRKNAEDENTAEKNQAFSEFHPFRYHMDIVKMRLYQLAAKLP